VVKYSGRLGLQLLIIGIVGAVSACGYKLQGAGTILPPDVRKIAIAPVEDDTTEPGLGQRFSEALRSRFERYGVVEIVEREGQADAVLSSKIREVEAKVRNTTSQNDVAIDQDLVLSVSAELKKRNGQLLWRDTNMRVTQSFAGTGDVVVTSSADFAQGNINSDALRSLSTNEVARGQKDQVLDELIEEAARRIYASAVAEDF
jgi:outer membrane lipopolysaccharide assembly protein LptE/RlpB